MAVHTTASSTKRAYVTRSARRSTAYRIAGSRHADDTSGKCSQTTVNVEKPKAIAPMVEASSE
jgi:hypothetical protein